MKSFVTIRYYKILKIVIKTNQKFFVYKALTRKS